MAPKKVKERPSLPFGGVNVGEEISIDMAAWNNYTPQGPAVLEVNLAHSSLGVGTEEWFAMIVDHVTREDDGSWSLAGVFLGTESLSLGDQIESILVDGGVHLCREDPCPGLGMYHAVIHVTKVRWWPVEEFEAYYTTPEGRASLTKRIKQLGEEAKKRERQKKREEDKSKRTALPAEKKPGGRRGLGKAPKKPGVPPDPKAPDPGEVIEVSDGGDENEEVPEDARRAGTGPAALRRILAETKQRILGTGGKRKAASEAPLGGLKRRSTEPAVEKPGLVAGVSLNPRRSTMTALVPVEDTSGTGTSGLVRRLQGKDDMSSQLLAQAVQSAVTEKERRKKKKKKETTAEMLVKLLSDKKKKKKSKKRKKGALKPDPGDPGDWDEESSEEESGSGEDPEEGAAAEDSDSSCEAPLKRKATKRPGSVMEMLVRHAQSQLDQGAVLEATAENLPVTQGVKLATYFSLLIRPYFPGNSPILRELYALAQSIDLLRSGKLPQAADSLAARFVACHLALTEGHWGTASQMEMFPLEPTQSVSTAVMLKAQKHKRLVNKSQGYGGGWGWNGGGRGKGAYGQEKGKKGDGKGKGKGKNKGKNKDGGWSQASKGDANPWEKNKEDPKKP